MPEPNTEQRDIILVLSLSEDSPEQELHSCIANTVHL